MTTIDIIPIVRKREEGSRDLLYVFPLFYRDKSSHALISTKYQLQESHDYLWYLRIQRKASQHKVWGTRFIDSKVKVKDLGLDFKLSICSGEDESVREVIIPLLFYAEPTPVTYTSPFLKSLTRGEVSSLENGSLGRNYQTHWTNLDELVRSQEEIAYAPILSGYSRRDAKFIHQLMNPTPEVTHFFS